MDHLPDPKTYCHRTGFKRTCHQCLTKFGCQLWKRLVLSADRETGTVKREIYGCADALAHTLMLNMLGRKDTTSATVDKLAKTVAESNDQGMGSVLARINAQMQHDREVRAQLTMEMEPKMLEGAK